MPPLKRLVTHDRDATCALIMPISGEFEIGGLALIVAIWRKRPPHMQTPGAVGGRAQFQLWIFSYTIRPRSSKKWVSRLMIGRGDGFGRSHLVTEDT